MSRICVRCLRRHVNVSDIVLHGGRSPFALWRRGGIKVKVVDGQTAEGVAVEGDELAREKAPGRAHPVGRARLAAAPPAARIRTHQLRRASGKILVIIPKKLPKKCIKNSTTQKLYIKIYIISKKKSLKKNLIIYTTF